jgi:aspartate-semialdehyde dehydrogenase
MPSDRDSPRIVIAGASSLLGAELKSLLEQSRFAGWDISLVDEEAAAGTLTEAGGEPAVIRPVEEGTFDRAKLIFFSGSAQFTSANLAAAQSSHATVIDLSGAALDVREASVWFAAGDVDKGKAVYAIPSAPGLITGKLFAALGNALSRLALLFFRPVSEAGRAGVEELEAQTSQLLSFQSVGQPVFDTQVAFNLLDHYGSASHHNLASVRERIRREVSLATGENPVKPSVQVLHAPVFYGYTFVALAELKSPQDRQSVVDACLKAGFSVDATEPLPLGNLTASGDSAIHLALPEPDSSQPAGWWLWGAADNIRLPAAAAIKLAEKLLA